MQFPILRSMLGDQGLQQLIKSWPDECHHAHGSLNRLPAPLSDRLLSSISELTEAYQGILHEFDPGKGESRLYRIAEGSAGDVIERGTTAYLDDVSPLLDNAENFVKALEQELNINPGSAKLTVFISAAGTGAPVHYDALDVISVQLVGDKKFYTSPLQQIRFPYDRQYSEGAPPFTALYPQISKGYPSCTNQSFAQVDMKPGSVLFMPRGTWHYTEAEQDSMAMSIVLSPYTQVDYLLSQLKTTLLQSSAWRAPCYGLGNKSSVNTKLYDRLSNTIYKIAKDQQNPDSPIRGFNKDSRYLRNPGVEVRITPGQRLYRVEYPKFDDEAIIGTVKLEVPQQIAGVIQWFTQQEGPFSLGECSKKFPSISAKDFQELFLRAEKSGLLKKLWFVEL